MAIPMYRKCDLYNFQELFKRKGYAYFTKGAYNLNIIGIRTNHNNKVTNKFDDFLVVIYNNEKGREIRCIYRITTEPGVSFMKNPLNKKGTAILVPDQYRGTYKIDKHRGKYEALCQRNKPVKVYRDGNKDDVYDMLPETIESGMFGINIHRSNEWVDATAVNKYSAGCQVFESPVSFKSFMTIVKRSAAIYGNSFTYTLITEDDMV